MLKKRLSRHYRAMTEKRADTRFDITFRCQFNTVSQAFTAHTENLSLGGALVRLQEKVHLNDKVPLQEDLKASEYITNELQEGDIAQCYFDVNDLCFHIPSEVKRVTPQNVALEFTKLKPEQIHQLHVFINTHSQ